MRKVILLCSLLMAGVQFSGVYSQPSSVPSTESGGPLSLGAAIQTGLDNNPELKSSHEKINASRGRFWNSISPSSPEVSFAHDYIPAGRNLNNYGEKTIGVSQTLEFPTNYFLRGSKYSIEKEMAGNEYALAKLGVISSIKKAYFNVLALQEQVKIAQENCAIAQDFVRKAEVRHSVGEGTNLEKLTAKVNYTEAMNNVGIQKNHLAAAFSELNFALGYGKGESKTYQMTDTLAIVPCNFTLEQLSNDAAAANPLLKANKLRVDSYALEKSLAWSGLLPNFNLAYFNKQVKDDAAGYYGAAISIGVPLWFMMDQRGKIIEASSNAAAARADLKTINNSIHTRTQAAFVEFKHEESQVRLHVEEILPQAEEVFRTAAKSYEAGEITYIEFLQAQQTLINARGSYAGALLSYNLSIVAIEEAVGKTLK
jgi:heavy metal efflux system protein